MRFLSCSTEAKSKLVSTQILKVVYQRSEPTRRTKSPVKEVILSLQSESPDKPPWVWEPCIIWGIFSQCRICNTTDTSDTTSLLALVTKRTHNNLKCLCSSVCFKHAYFSRIFIHFQSLLFHIVRTRDGVLTGSKQ